MRENSQVCEPTAFLPGGIKLFKGVVMEKVTSSVETIEGEAEKVLDEAKSRAGEILAGATEESRKILSSGFSLDEVKADCQKIVETARKESEAATEESRKKAKTARQSAEKMVGGVVKKILTKVTGEI